MNPVHTLPTCLRSTLILFSHLHPGLPSGLLGGIKILRAKPKQPSSYSELG
jgi:hypothetical protein